MIAIIGLIVGIVSLLTASGSAVFVIKKDEGKGKMVEISKFIREGAMTFLNTEYKSLSIFIVVVAVLLYIGSLIKGSGISQYTWVSLSLERSFQHFLEILG